LFIGVILSLAAIISLNSHIVLVEVFKPQCDLCVEEFKKNIEELQDNLEGKDRERKQEVAILCGPICEREKMIAARDGEMDATQRTVQVHVEDITPQEDSCVLQQKDEEECVEETLQGQVEDSKETEQLIQETNEDVLVEETPFGTNRAAGVSDSIK